LLSHRNFLLFLPTDTQTPPLKAVLSYYSSTYALNAEGDTSIREETLEGLGTISPVFLNYLFGAVIKIAMPPPPRSRAFPSNPTPPQSDPVTSATTDEASERKMLEANQAHFVQAPLETTARPHLPFPGPSASEAESDQQELNDKQLSDKIASPKKSLLTSLLPHPGYFAAGGLAGVVSRTATAPLDRLKVYLIAHTGPVVGSLEVAKKGNVGEVTKQFGRPIILAYRDLLQAGGWRNLFAGKSELANYLGFRLIHLGNGLNVAKVMPESAIKFGSYEGAKRVCAYLEGHGDPQRINPYSKFIAGGMAGLISQYV
jgi:solute carrier family 25 phosphate transporter 23/24/25/41